MIPALPSPLRRADRVLLVAAQWLVPTHVRKDWLRGWQAELWCGAHARKRDGAPGLLSGVIRDALWLRGDSVRQALTGTPFLCISMLMSLLLIATIPAIIAAGSLRGFLLIAAGSVTRIAVESSLVGFVSLAAGVTSLEQNLSGAQRLRLKARLFFFAKMVLVLLLAWMLSMDLAWPIHAFLPLTTLVLQSVTFVLLSLLGLRWSSLDSALRCQNCLCSLASPARVGRPSWNLLEFTGTELECKHGHGHLSIPEIETSWHQSSVWVAMD